MADDEFEVSPGRSHDGDAGSYRKADRLVGRVLQVSRRAGYTPLGRRKSKRGTGHLGRGRRAARQRHGNAFQRRVVIKARVVRHNGSRFRSAPLARHISYLERDGVTRDGSEGQMFDARSDEVDGNAFAARCEEDRHHFRFIVSPEDASELADLKTFTRELMEDMARDLDTRLDWVAVDHWNTDNPHVHVLVRGIARDGKDLVIDRAYISEGLRARAQERATIELGPRSERDIERVLKREVDAERWTSLDRGLQRQRDDFGVVDLRPEAAPVQRKDRSFLIGRAQVLERMGLAECVGPASWTLAADIEPTLRALGERGDIIKTTHRAMSGERFAGGAVVPALHHDPADRVIGRLVERGLHDELTGEAYAIVEGLDGRAHHVRFGDFERTGDAKPGAIVETGCWTDRRGRERTSLLVRSDFPLEQQVDARGATWLDRQLVTPNPEPLAGSFGREVEEALERRTEALIEEGLARRTGGQVVFARNLLAQLKERDLSQAGEELAGQYARQAGRPVAQGDLVAGIYRERVTLASGRFAMIDDGLGFRLVPWRQDLERHLGSEVTGRVNARGGVDWSFTRSRGLAL